MRAVTDKNMAELLLQMRFMPTEKKRAQLEAAEQLTCIIDDAGQYPLEFIWYRITGHRPRSIPDEVIPGDRLRGQLLSFIARLSNQIAQPMEQFGQKVYSKDQLAQKFKVSTKTIERWRQRGLVARKFAFPDGKKRLGFTEESVRRFSAAEPELVEKAGRFERLTEAQRARIITRAQQLAQRPEISTHSIIAQIAAETNRAHETVRCILAEHNKAQPGKAICSSRNSALTPGQAAEIFRLYHQSTPVAELMRLFNRSKSTIYRVIKHKRGRAILGCRLEYIASEEFDRPEAEQALLGKSLEADYYQTVAVSQQTGESFKKYLKAIRNSPALNREAEQKLFRRYNFLKYLVCKHRRALAGGDFSGKMLSLLEDYLGRAERIKNLLVESNLGIVVSVANRHAGAGHSLADLVSEGNFSLLRAVEKFDYRRGNRFRTYAWLVIAKDFARKIPAERSRPDKAGGMDVEGIEQRLRWTVGRELAAIEQARANLVAVVRDNLDQRGQYIIFNHFGLLSTGIRKQTKTLQQIGDELGLTKERVRQLELQALQRLKHYVSQEEFELLTS